MVCPYRTAPERIYGPGQVKLARHTAALQASHALLLLQDVYPVKISTPQSKPVSPRLGLYRVPQRLKMKRNAIKSFPREEKMNRNAIKSIPREEK